MTDLTFTIPGRLPSGRDLEKAARRHWAVHQKLKNESMELVHIALFKAKAKRMAEPVEIDITCYEPNLKRDEDNVKSGALKIILDALQNHGVITNDNRTVISRQECIVALDRDRPRIEVKIKGSRESEKHADGSEQLSL